MRFRHFAEAFAPVAGMAFAATFLSRCEDDRFPCGDNEGKPLAELDLSGPAPHELTLAGADTVRISLGDNLTITIDGDDQAAERLRFSLNEGKLKIFRPSPRSWSDRGKVTINVTMPAPRALTLAGSGSIFVPTLAADAAVNIAGSGSIETPQLAAEAVKVNVAGSGEYRAGGTARRLKLSIAGSGDAAMDGLRVYSAKVKIAGSGSTRFASDGTVEARIMGSGEVRVRGRAACTVNVMGSGRLVCEPGEPGAPSPGAAPPP